MKDTLAKASSLLLDEPFGANTGNNYDIISAGGGYGGIPLGRP
jgi:hypothetical protein